MNVAILKGNLVRDPELSYTPSGIAVCKFTIAVPHPYHPKDKDKTFFPKCVAWKKTGELIQQYFKKGQQILVRGFTEEQRWEQEGQKRSAIQVTVETFEFCGSNQGSTSQAPQASDDDIPF